MQHDQPLQCGYPSFLVLTQKLNGERIHSGLVVKQIFVFLLEH